jgi:hypothetical protein
MTNIAASAAAVFLVAQPEYDTDCNARLFRLAFGLTGENKST